MDLFIIRIDSLEGPLSYLLFMDESGHDHRQMPYEVRGGVALSVSRLWRFVEEIHQAEQECFGGFLHHF